MAGPATILPGSNGLTTLAFARPIHPYCALEMEVDGAAAAQLDRLLVHARFDRDGRLAGRAIFARDFGAENHRLLTRFGDRTWYRYRPRSGPDDAGPLFVPYYGR
jgi:hypothetical protein